MGERKAHFSVEMLVKEIKLGSHYDPGRGIWNLQIKNNYISCFTLILYHFKLVAWFNLGVYKIIIMYESGASIRG